MVSKLLVKGLEWLLIAILGLMVILVFGNVVLRYGFNSGITFSEEVSRFLFVWMVFLGSVLMLRDNGHLGVHTFTSILPLWGKK
ncbi:MAG: Tripartite ATP-independent periplasmic transporter DctQ component, partial [Proteobacteria bacterium]|nr:Tripartite ATP-independent periplasmic transporter DctQ component [Pseudomonadota bacterium]